MAPKKEKKEKAPPPPPSFWVSNARCIENFSMNHGTLRTLRTGRPSVARGAIQLQEGKHRITYRINATGSRRGFGIVLGISDVEAPCWSELPLPDPNAEPDKKDAKKDKKDKKGGAEPPPPKPKPRNPFVAWGIVPSTGKFIATADAKHGGTPGVAQVFYDQSEVLSASLNGTQNIEGMTIVLEVMLSSTDRAESSLTRRSFAASLHPLAAPRSYPIHLEPLQRVGVQHLTGPIVGSRSSLSYSINGGAMIDTGATLPSALWPWVHSSWQGDSIELVSMETETDDGTGRMIWREMNMLPGGVPAS